MCSCLAVELWRYSMGQDVFHFEFRGLLNWIREILLRVDFSWSSDFAVWLEQHGSIEECVAQTEKN